MSLNHITFLGYQLRLPLKFTTDLPFTDDDKVAHPWLTEEVRRYGVITSFGKGGRAEALNGFVSKRDGTIDDAYRSFPLVLKVPNIDEAHFNASQITEYLFRQQEECGKEWQLTRERLRGSSYANPIFDVHVFQVLYKGRIVPVPITVQDFLADAIPLDKYLLETRQRSEPYRSLKGEPCDNWHGMSDPTKWVTLATAIARGLVDIHERRVVHGDIWPPNIFIRTHADGSVSPVFIDFGEAFPLEPIGTAAYQRDHAYRAPERSNAEHIVTKRADVYSFGKLLLHLATGQEPILSSGSKGHIRREDIKSRFRDRNPTLLKDNPFILDIVCNCLSPDSADRPSMNEVFKALTTYVGNVHCTTSSPDVDLKLCQLNDTWNSFRTRKVEVNPHFAEIVSQRIADVTRFISTLEKDAVNIKDTREYVVLALVGIFLKLQQGDRYISVTSPRMWQGPALGLNGRYFTANQIAASRGASIQRAFIVSCQELGFDWTMRLCDQLISMSGCPAAQELGKQFIAAAKGFRGACEEEATRELPSDVLEDCRERFRLVIKSYADATSSRELCEGLLEKGGDKFISFRDQEGIYVGIIPVATLAESRRMKAANPISVFQFDSLPASNRHLLMMTECVGRSSIDAEEHRSLADDEFLRSKPELRGAVLFKSVVGIPEDRIMTLEQQLRASVGIGSWAGSLLKAFDVAGK